MKTLIEILNENNPMPQAGCAGRPDDYQKYYMKWPTQVEGVYCVYEGECYNTNGLMPFPKMELTGVYAEPTQTIYSGSGYISKKEEPLYEGINLKDFDTALEAFYEAVMKSYCQKLVKQEVREQVEKLSKDDKNTILRYTRSNVEEFAYNKYIEGDTFVAWEYMSESHTDAIRKKELSSSIGGVCGYTNVFKYLIDPETAVEDEVKAHMEKYKDEVIEHALLIAEGEKEMERLTSHNVDQEKVRIIRALKPYANAQTLNVTLETCDKTITAKFHNVFRAHVKEKVTAYSAVNGKEYAKVNDGYGYYIEWEDIQKITYGRDCIYKKQTA